VQQEPEGVGQEAVTAEAVSAETVFKFLDAVLALAAIVEESENLGGAAGAAGVESVGASSPKRIFRRSDG